MFDKLPQDPSAAFVWLAGIAAVVWITGKAGPPACKLLTDFLTYLRTRDANTAAVVQQLLAREKAQDERFARLEAEAKVKDLRIAALEAELVTTRSENASLRLECSSLRAELADLHKQLDRVDPSKP